MKISTLDALNMAALVGGGKWHNDWATKPQPKAVSFDAPLLTFAVSPLSPTRDWVLQKKKYVEAITATMLHTSCC